MLLDLDYCHRSHTMLTRAKAVIVLVIRLEQFFQFSFSTLPTTDSINSNSLAYDSLDFIQHRHQYQSLPPPSTVTASFSSSFAFGSLAISTDGGSNDYHIIPHPTLTAVVRVNNFIIIIHLQHTIIK
mmetsp:Transcript_28389/g.41696  ORF Transcript_28389/g.41696 Transcript_28389/m.41696 type:complete len:127 (+) Transcript_28389:26-406(+)